jgi:hypothetical protein
VLGGRFARSGNCNPPGLSEQQIGAAVVWSKLLTANWMMDSGTNAVEAAWLFYRVNRVPNFTKGTLTA